jgi:anaerobic ribonucleoside-triphosphate reductase activating protein
VVLGLGPVGLCAAECAALARIARERGLNVWAYTGYTYERLLAGEVPDALALLEQVDVLVDGPFVEAEKSYAALFRGSTNQRLIDVPKSLAAGAVVLWERPDPLAHFTRPES